MESKTLVLLAGGSGSRLSNYLQKPGHVKCLSEFSGLVFLNYLLRQAEFAGIEEVIVLGGPQRELIARAVESEKYQLRFSYPVENQRLGTGGALKLVLPHLKEKKFYLMNADTYFAENPFLLIQHYMRSVQNDVRIQGHLFFDESNSQGKQVHSLGQNGCVQWVDLYSTTPYIYAGVALLSEVLLKDWAAGGIQGACSFEKEFFSLYKDQIQCHVYPFRHLDFGTGEGFENLQRLLKPKVAQ
ncbi:MAG: NTP transferase domain-containing protein [Bdellovibrio sp.]|nr:NTP transferase domain-containing protein [Bdellovibrio sp.]